MTAELVKEEKAGEGFGSPSLASADDKLFRVWLLGTGAKFRVPDSEEVFQIMQITHTDVLAASEKNEWAFEHETLVYLI